MNRFDQVDEWLDQRIGHRALIKHALEEPVPGGARWAYIFGSVLVGCITLQAITGWAMMAFYSPSATTAWASVEHLNYAVYGGWLVRGLHHFGAHAMIVVLGLHLLQVAIYAARIARLERSTGGSASASSASPWGSASPDISCPGTRRAIGRRASRPTSPARRLSWARRSSA